MANKAPRYLVLSCAGGVAAALVFTATLAHAEPRNVASLGALVDAAAQSAMIGGHCKAIAIGVRDGGIQATRFYGDTGNIGPPDANTEFEIGSITKTFTATLLALAGERAATNATGSPVMRLGDPLQAYAPQGIRVPRYNGRGITLVDLATHTSGLPRAMQGAKHPTAAPAWSYLSRVSLLSEPGRQFLYSNLGFGILALAMVHASGKNLEKLYAEQITGPLAMGDTRLVLNRNQKRRLAKGYFPNGAPAPWGLAAFPAMNGSGALYSTLSDMMKYLAYQLGETAVSLDSVLPILHQSRHAAGPNGSVGLAWQMRTLPNGAEVISKNGATAGFSTMMSFVPATKTGVVVLANQRKCPVGRIAQRIIGGLNDTVAQLSEPMEEEQPD